MEASTKPVTEKVEKLTLFPICRTCQQGSLLLMPRVRQSDPYVVYCMGCQRQESIAEVLWVTR